MVTYLKLTAGFAAVRALGYWVWRFVVDLLILTRAAFLILGASARSERGCLEPVSFRGTAAARSCPSTCALCRRSDPSADGASCQRGAIPVRAFDVPGNSSQ
jgi:hypothetical protein